MAFGKTVSRCERTSVRNFSRGERALAMIFSVMAVAFQPPKTVHADTGTNWTGAYFNNKNLQGSPVFTRIDPAVVFNWGPNSPGPGIGSSNWSARWLAVLRQHGTTPADCDKVSAAFNYSGFELDPAVVLANR